MQAINSQEALGVEHHLLDSIHHSDFDQNRRVSSKHDLVHTIQPEIHSENELIGQNRGPKEMN